MKPDRTPDFSHEPPADSLNSGPVLESRIRAAVADLLAYSLTEADGKPSGAFPVHRWGKGDVGEEVRSISELGSNHKVNADYFYTILESHGNDLDLAGFHQKLKALGVDILSDEFKRSSDRGRIAGELITGIELRHAFGEPGSSAPSSHSRFIKMVRNAVNAVPLQIAFSVLDDSDSRVEREELEKSDGAKTVFKRTLADPRHKEVLEATPDLLPDLWYSHFSGHLLAGLFAKFRDIQDSGEMRKLINAALSRKMAESVGWALGNKSAVDGFAEVMSGERTLEDFKELTHANQQRASQLHIDLIIDISRDARAYLEENFSQISAGVDAEVIEDQRVPQWRQLINSFGGRIESMRNRNIGEFSEIACDALEDLQEILPMMTSQLRERADYYGGLGILDSQIRDLYKHSDALLSLIYINSSHRVVAEVMPPSVLERVVQLFADFEERHAECQTKWRPPLIELRSYVADTAAVLSMFWAYIAGGCDGAPASSELNRLLNAAAGIEAVVKDGGLTLVRSGFRGPETIEVTRPNVPDRRVGEALHKVQEIFSAFISDQYFDSVILAAERIVSETRRSVSSGR